jgi:superfamily I DNA and/or RNA helicase
MNNIARDISNSIKEGKWLAITYENLKEGRDTSFWCAISDADAKSKILTADIFNSEKNSSALLSTKLHFERIKSTSVIDFSTYDVPTTLIEKLEKHPLDFDWLHFENFNNNILMYLQECNRLDTDPFQKNYAMVSEIDLHLLKDKKTVSLSDEQIQEIVKAIYFNDLKKFNNASNEMALSALSIDSAGKKFVVAYYTVCFNPSKRSLSLIGGVHFNNSFLIDGIRHSLGQYLDLTPDEFIEAYKKDPVGTTQILKESLNGGEVVNTRPDFMILERDMIVNLSKLFEMIEAKRDNGTLNVPVKAFFGDISVKNNGRKEPAIVIYDKRINIDQMRVLYNVMKNPVTYVQGPPGTGKTQTLFNVLVSAYFNNKSVLVCSMNNKPVDGIIEKLVFQYKGGTIPFPFLRLGNKLEAAKATLKIREDFDAKFKGKPDFGKIADIKAQETEKNAELVGLLTKYEQRKAIEDSVERAEKMARYLDKPNERLDSEIAKLKEELNAFPAVTNEQVLTLFSAASENPRYLTYLYFSSIARLSRLQQPKYAELRQIVSVVDGDARVDQFNHWISDDENIRLLVDVYPLIFTTNVSANRLGSGDFMFDLTVMDEAGQCDVTKSLIPIARGNALLLVGDKDQLQPVVVLDPAVNEKLREKYHIGHGYDYIQNSIITLMQNADNISKRIMLSYHYRCGKKIISFSNQYFYGKSLKLGSANGDGYLALEDVHNGTKTARNECYDEAKGIVDFVARNHIKDTVIITPFLAQQRLINRMLSQAAVKDVQACTIHSVQGAEQKSVIISPAVSSRTSERTFQWLASHKEIANVAVTRAQDNLLVFGDSEAIAKLSEKQDNVWNQLINYAKKNGEYKVVPPSPDTPNIGKSNGSLNEDEFFKTMAQFCSITKNHRIERNVMVKDAFPDDPDLASSKQEFDLLVYQKRSFFHSERLIMAFEVNGGEHNGDPRRERLDQIKRELCEKKGVTLVSIDNGTVKDYECLREMILKLSNQKYEQLPLF